MAVNLKTATPDTTIPSDGFLFGADSQSASAPSVYPLSALAQTLLGSTAFSGDTVTASKPLLDLVQTWNNAAVTFTADKINVTNTASNAASLLFDRRVGDVSKFSIRADGLTTVAGGLTVGGASLGANMLAVTGSGIFSAGVATGASFTYSAACYGNSSGLSANATGEVGGIYLALGPNLGALNTKLHADGSNILGLRNGTNAQAFNVYNTYTDASN